MQDRPVSSPSTTTTTPYSGHSPYRGNMRRDSYQRLETGDTEHGTGQARPSPASRGPWALLATQPNASCMPSFCSFCHCDGAGTCHRDLLLLLLLQGSIPLPLLFTPRFVSSDPDLLASLVGLAHLLQPIPYPFQFYGRRRRTVAEYGVFSAQPGQVGSGR